MRRKKTDTPQPTLPQQSGFKKVRRTEEFIEAVKDETAQPQTVTIAAEVVEDNEPFDRFEEFFSRVKEEQGWTLLVFRLNNYHKDGKTSLRGDKTYVGKITFDPDTYLDDIQGMCPEGGAFKLQAKTPDNRYSEQWMEQIMPLKGKAAQAANTHYFIQPPTENGQAPEPPRDTLKEFLQSLKTVKEIKEVIGNGSENAQPIQPAAVTVEREPLQDRIVEAALNFALKTEKPETVAGLLQSYLNPRADEFSWKEIIGEVVKPMVPMFMGLVSAYMQAQAAKAQQQGQTTSVVQPTQQALQPMPQQPQPPLTGLQDSAMFHQGAQPQQAQPAFVMPAMEMPQNQPAAFQSQPQLEPEDEDEMAENSLLDDLVEMLQICVNKMASDPAIIEAGRQEIVAFRERFPNATQILDMLASAPPVAVIGMLCFNYPQVAPLIGNPVAIQVIEDLQAALKRPEVEA